MKHYCGALLAIYCWILGVQVAGAESRAPLAEDQVTPDPLLQSTQPGQRDKSYGSEGLYIQEGGDKDKAQITPDPLERSVQPPGAPGEEVPIELPELEREATDSAGKSGDRAGGREAGRQQTPDPLLNNIGR